MKMISSSYHSVDIQFVNLLFTSNIIVIKEIPSMHPDTYRPLYSQQLLPIHYIKKSLLNTNPVKGFTK